MHTCTRVIFFIRNVSAVIVLAHMLERYYSDDFLSFFFKKLVICFYEDRGLHLSIHVKSALISIHLGAELHTTAYL